MVKKNKILIGLVLLLLFLSFPTKLANGDSCDDYLINKIRCESGVAPVMLNSNLNASALAKAQLLENGSIEWGQSAHDGFSSLINKFDNKFRWVGEDLAMDFDTEEEIYQAWINSPKHYEVMTSKKATQFGYACANEYCVLHMGAY